MCPTACAASTQNNALAFRAAFPILLTGNTEPKTLDIKLQVTRAAPSILWY